MSKLTAYDDKVIIKPNGAESITSGGVIIPDTAQEDTMIGEVISIGPGRYDFNGKRVPMDTAVGDLVVFPKFGPMKFEYNDEQYIIAKEGELLARVNTPTVSEGNETSEKQLLHD